MNYAKNLTHKKLLRITTKKSTVFNEKKINCVTTLIKKKKLILLVTQIRKKKKLVILRLNI